MHPVTTRASLLQLALRILLLAWAGFWAWFVLAASYGGAETAPPWWIPVVWLTALAALVLLGWRWPTAGGAVLVPTSLAAAIYFHTPSAQALLALPALLLGLGCLWLGLHGSSDSRRAES